MKVILAPLRFEGLTADAFAAESGVDEVILEPVP